MIRSGMRLELCGWQRVDEALVYASATQADPATESMKI